MSHDESYVFSHKCKKAMPIYYKCAVEKCPVRAKVDYDFDKMQEFLVANSKRHTHGSKEMAKQLLI